MGSRCCGVTIYANVCTNYKPTSILTNLSIRADPLRIKKDVQYFLNISDRCYGFAISDEMRTACISLHDTDAVWNVVTQTSVPGQVCGQDTETLENIRTTQGHRDACVGTDKHTHCQCASKPAKFISKSGFSRQG